MTRGHTGPYADTDQNYNFYCRSCGRLHTQKDFPEHCSWCGSTLDDEGFGVSGDAGRVDVYVSGDQRPRIVTIDKPIN